MSVQEQFSSRPLPVPEDFPVTWEDPAEKHLFWQQWTQHFPNQVTMLELDVTGQLTTRALTYMGQLYDIPVKEWRTRRINTYLYRATVAVPYHEMAAMGRRSQQKFEAASLRLEEEWEELLPEIEEHLAVMGRCDVTVGSTGELLAHLDDVLTRLERLWQIHFTLQFSFPISEFDDLYRDLFDADGTFDSYRLLGGFPNKTLEVGQALWELSRRAQTLPEVRRVLEREAASKVVAALEATDEGSAFLGELRAYLDVYGRRSEGMQIAIPSWIEDPTPVIGNLQRYLTQPDGANPALASERASREREEAIAHARQRLAGYPQPVVEQFEAWLEAAQVGTVLSEDHTFYIDFGGQYQARRVIVEAGRRLAEAGLLASTDDVFLLRLDELRDAMASFPNLDRRTIAEERRAEMDRFRDVRPPRVLGTPPPPRPRDAAERTDSMGRYMQRFWGGPPAEPAEPGTLRGNAGSPGTTRGPARVIGTLAEAERLQPGDILVTATTAAPWTPLFATAAAVVTDTGGILSHCAVVAREYGIPAVVGVGNATSVIKDGQPIEVDGDAGIVHLQPGHA